MTRKRTSPSESADPVRRRLQHLYLRKSVLDAVIRCLENYERSRTRSLRRR